MKYLVEFRKAKLGEKFISTERLEDFFITSQLMIDESGDDIWRFVVIGELDDCKYASPESPITFMAGDAWLNPRTHQMLRWNGSRFENVSDDATTQSLSPSEFPSQSEITRRWR